MLRYARLYAYCIRFAFSRAMEFRFDFFFRIVMDMAFYAVNIAFFKVIYNHIDDIAGWSESQILVFVAGYLFVDAVNITLFANNNWVCPLLVNHGDLDDYLGRPVSSFFFVCYRDFAANSFLNLLMPLGILGWAVSNCEQVPGFPAVLLFVLMLIMGSFLQHAMFMLFLIPVFWAHQVDGFRTLSWGLTQLGERPHRIYAQGLQRALVSFIPAGLVASLPAYVLFEGLTWMTGLHFVGVITGFFALLLFIWRLGLRAYSSASS